MEHIGKNIKKIRKKLGIKQGILAKDLNISSTYLSLVENGHKDPSLKLIMEISEKLNVDPSFIITKDDSYFAMQNILKEADLPQIVSVLENMIDLIEKKKTETVE